MNLVVKVNNIDRTNYISWPSFQKEDNLNSQVDVCSFETKRYGAKTWKPAAGEEIEVSLDERTFNLPVGWTNIKPAIKADVYTAQDIINQIQGTSMVRSVDPITSQTIAFRTSSGMGLNFSITDSNNENIFIYVASSASIILQIEPVKIFSGVVVQVEEHVEGQLLKYQVDCKDWTHYLDRNLVVERYENMTVNAIIADLLANYASGFTGNNVNCDIGVKSIAFNRLPVSKCLQALAEQVNFNWYPDYEKDIHFFAKNSEPAPFGLTDTNGKYVFSSLRIKEDISQLRNTVIVRGGEIEGSPRTENFTGDGTKTTFALGYKFSSLPAVAIGGVTKTVGVDYLDQDASFNCLWNFNEKYVRFVSAPAAGAAITASGTPLVPLIVQVRDEVSADKYGIYEFSLIDKSITTIEEARQYATAQLDAYASKVAEGNFDTYEPCLRSGQVINIQSDIRGLNEDYVIQRVNLSMRSPTDGLWSIQLATVRTMGIIDFLQRLFISQNKEISIEENSILEKSYLISETAGVEELITKLSPYTDQQTAQVVESISKDPLGAGVSPDWVLAPHIPTGHDDTKREGLLDYSFIVY